MPNEIEKLIQDLSAESPEIRERALDMIGALNPDNAFEIILPSLSDEDPGVRGTAACNLGEIEDGRAIEYLINLVKSDSSEEVRSEALSSLEKYRDSSILQCLIDEVNRVKQSRRPRQIVAKQLQYYDTEESVDALIALLQDEDIYVRIWAADSLYVLNRVRLREIWKTALEDESEYVWQLAKKALKKLDK